MLDATAIILSGGKSSRMGKNKAFLEVGEQRIIDSIVARLQTIFPQIIIVSNEPLQYEYLKTEVVSDLVPGLGPLSGMHAGLLAADHYFSLIMPCDMPFVETSLARMLVREAPGYDVAVPQVGSYLQPLFAVYARSCLGPIEQCLEKSISKVTSLYPLLRVNYISETRIMGIADPDKVFFNINTPEELDKARQLKETEEL